MLDVIVFLSLLLPLGAAFALVALLVHLLTGREGGPTSAKKELL